MKLLLVDDHPIFCAGLRLLLQSHCPGAAFAEATTAAAALELAEELKPDLVFMDIHLPDQNGIGATRALLARFPGTKIIILSAEPNLACVNQALQAGALAYVEKQSAAAELPRALEAVRAGKVYLCPEALAAMVEDYRHALAAPPKPAPPALSPREREVLLLVADGLRTKEVAQRMQVGIKTAETYRHRLLKKLRFQSTAEVVRYAIREGLLQP